MTTIYIYSTRFNNNDYKSLNYSEALKACDGWAHIWIEYYVFTDIHIDKKKEAEKIYKVLDKFILKNRIKRYFMIVGYSPKRYKTNTLIFHQEYSKNGKSKETSYHEGILSNYVNINQAVMNESEIKKVELSDIISSFK